MADDPYHLLFVCSGNICRSPMAEVLAQHYAAQRGRPIEARSAGTLGIDGRAAAPNAIAVCREIGLDLSGHRSQGVRPSLLDQADYVLVMEHHHARFLRERWPEKVADNLLMLGNFGGMLEIPDPIGSFKYKFRRSRDDIRQSVELFIDRLPPRQGPRDA